MNKAKIVVTVVTSIDLHGIDPQVFAENIKDILNDGYSDGRITGVSEAEVNFWEVKSEVFNGD